VSEVFKEWSTLSVQRPPEDCRLLKEENQKNIQAEYAPCESPKTEIWEGKAANTANIEESDEHLGVDSIESMVSAKCDEVAGIRTLDVDHRQVMVG